MRIRIQHLLRTSILSVCVCPLPQASQGHAAEALKNASSSRLREVQPANGTREGRVVTAGNAPKAKLTIVSSAVQPPAGSQPPVGSQPPASRGPIDLLSPQSDPTSQPPAASPGLGDIVNQAENALTPLQSRELSIPVQVVDLSVAGLGTGLLPESASARRQTYPYQTRGGVFKCVHWHPSNICHFPLRFEEPMLERHGHVRFGHFQSLASGAKFFSTIPMLPYLHTLRPSWEPVYALGNYRAGSRAPLLRETIPYDRQAAVVEALSLAGFFWALPL